MGSGLADALAGVATLATTTLLLLTVTSVVYREKYPHLAFAAIIDGDREAWWQVQLTGIGDRFGKPEQTQLVLGLV